MTTIYFVRHAEPNYQNHEDAARELSEKGLRDRQLVTIFFRNIHIDEILSSPYKRAMDTVAHLAQTRDVSINVNDDFRERKIGNGWIDDFNGFCRRQWDNFEYKYPDGESLYEVQKRNISALMEALNQFQDKTLVIGSHGTALSTIIQYYDRSFGYKDFIRIKDLMPWIVKFTFDGENCTQIEEFICFQNKTTERE